MSGTLVEYILNLNGNLEGKINSADAATNKLHSSVNSLMGSLGLVAGIAGVAMFVKKVVEAGSVVENATTGLTTLLKDSAGAAMVVKNTMEDAVKTPFAFEGLLSANKALISAGISAEKARADVLNLANAIAATGGTDVELQRMVINMQQISNTGKATALDIKQFGYAGINIYKVLAEATGKSIAQVKDMEVSYDMLTMALDKAHKKGGIYFNGLENMAGNTSVKISNIGDSLFQMFNNIFVETKPIIDVALNGTLSLMSSLSNGLISTIKFMKEYNGVILMIAGSYAAHKIAVLGAIALDKLSVMWKGASAVASELLLAWDIARAEGLGVLAAAQWALNVAMNANPIGMIITAVGALIGGVVALSVHFGGLGKAMTAVWDMAKALGTGIANVFKGVGEIIAGVFTLNPAMISKGFDDIVSAAKSSAKNIADIWNAPEKEKSLIGKEGKAGPGGKPASTALATPKTKAEGQKTINIHVAYNAPLIQGFTISTTNIQEGLGSLKEKVSAILVGATHDALMVADN